jgi:hypothetical protein
MKMVEDEAMTQHQERSNQLLIDLYGIIAKFNGYYKIKFLGLQDGGQKSTNCKVF